MTKLNKKIKTALDESRILVLGTQILLGFQYRAFFENTFDSMTMPARYLLLAGLIVLLIAIALILLPGSYHRIVYRGQDATEVHTFATSVMDFALLPLMLALAGDVYLVTSRVWGTRGGLVPSVAIAMVASFLWYGLGGLSRWRHWDKDAGEKEERTKGGAMQKTEITDKVEQVLTEARVVLPGAQALLGFQFATMLMETFQKLPYSSQYVHAVSLLCIGISVILLMTPAAYHRIVERGEDTEHFHSVASWLVLTAMVFLPVGICGELYVVVRRLTDSNKIGLFSSALGLIFFYALWFGFTTYKKTRLSSLTKGQTG